MDVGGEIKKMRKAANLTQAQLASLSGVATITIRQYEAGKRQPSVLQLKKIAAVFGVNWYELYPDDHQGRAVVDHMKGLLSGFQVDSDSLVDGIDWDWVLANNPDAFIDEDSLRRQSLMRVDHAFTKLNDDGIHEAVKRVEELTELPKYQANESPEDTKTPQAEAQGTQEE